MKFREILNEDELAEAEARGTLDVELKVPMVVCQCPRCGYGLRGKFLFERLPFVQCKCGWNNRTEAPKNIRILRLDGSVELAEQETPKVLR